MQNSGELENYGWSSSEFVCSHDHLAPTLKSILLAEKKSSSRGNDLIDVGCGNGAVTSFFSSLGFHAMGVEPSLDGVLAARRAFPGITFEHASAYEDLSGRFGRFDYVVSLEVVEHLFDPRKYAATLYDLTKDDGVAIVSTPYHGYWKNLALAVLGKWDFHLSPLWDHGHIKFWSINSLTTLLQEAGFRDIKFYRVGRIPTLAKSMIAVARR